MKMIFEEFVGTVAAMLQQAVPEVFKLDWRAVSEGYSPGFMLSLADRLPADQGLYMLMQKLMRQQAMRESAGDVNADIEFEALDATMLLVIERKYHCSYLEWMHARDMPLNSYLEVLGLPPVVELKVGDELIGGFDDLVRRYGRHRPTLADAFGANLIGDNDPINVIGILMAAARAANVIGPDTSRKVFVGMVYEAHPQFFGAKRTTERVEGAVNDLLANKSIREVSDSGSLKHFVDSLYVHPNKQEKMWGLASDIFRKLK